MSDPRQANQDDTLADFVNVWIAKGREQERRDIVAWLRQCGDVSGRYLAVDIENGTHLGGDDE